MLTLSDAAVDAIRLASATTRPAHRSVPGRTLPMWLLTVASASGAVRLEPIDDPAPDDVVISRGGVTVYLDRDLAARLYDKIQHAHATNDDLASVAFTLLNRP